MDDWFSPRADAVDSEQAPKDHSEEHRHPPCVMILPASPDLIAIVFRGTYSPVKNHTQW